MSADFLETDKAIEALLEELHSLKPTAQQLQVAERNANQVIQSAEKVTDLSAQVIQGTTKQADAVSKLVAETEKRMQELIAEQKAFANATERFLRSDLQPKVEYLHKVSITIMWLVFFLFLLTVANMALAVWLNRDVLLP